MPRDAQCNLIIGFNGTGKTTFLKKDIVLPALKRKERVLIVTPDYSEWLTIPEVHSTHKHHISTYVGARRIIYTGMETLAVINDYFRNGTVIFDDMRAYLDAKTHNFIKIILIRRRQRMMDIFGVAHGFREVPPAFFTFSNHFILFRTVDNLKTRAKDLNNPELIMQYQQYVNLQSEKNPHFKLLIKNN